MAVLPLPGLCGGAAHITWPLWWCYHVTWSCGGATTSLLGGATTSSFSRRRATTSSFFLGGATSSFCLAVPLHHLFCGTTTSSLLAINLSYLFSISSFVISSRLISTFSRYTSRHISNDFFIYISYPTTITSVIIFV